MAEYIKRNKVLSGIDKAFNDFSEHDGDILNLYADARLAVINVPAADVAEIVRCRECKFYKRDYCNIWCRWTNKNVFCSHGERKED